MSVLLVDDDPAAIQLMERILASVGSLRFATNGSDALRLALESPPDLVARYGGEEFMILLPRTPRRGAQHRAQHVLDAVKALYIFHENSQTTHYVTVGALGRSRKRCAPPMFGNAQSFYRISA
jgi:PleD family two-component response regulator